MAAVYDYDRQAWVDDPCMLRKQLEEERSLVSSPSGLEYMRMIGCKLTVKEYVAAIDRELATLPSFEQIRNSL